MKLRKITTWSLVIAFAVGVLFCCHGSSADILSSFVSTFQKSAHACCPKSVDTKTSSQGSCPDCQKQYIKADAQGTLVSSLKASFLAFVIQKPIVLFFAAIRLVLSHSPPALSSGPTLFISFHQFRL